MKLVLPTASGRTPVQNRSAVRRSPAERGIALVITLILLSVTLVMALAFLALGRREREAVATGTDATQARLAADSALAAAQAQLVANIFATSNSFNYGLFVSTNYITPGGFNNLLGYSTNNNVNYYYPNGNFLTGADLAQNIGNLQILPRVPVFPGTNGEFRYFLDLNRNGRFDTNGFIAEWVTNASGQLVTNGNFVFEVGDPEWVGILERPDMTHSPINKATSRYAFVAMPADAGLDINAIHNQAKTYALTANDGYFRNQGVGSWELNLAAFFADLNTNIWSPYEYPNNNAFYAYNETNNNFNTGVAFDDARSFLAYRYNFNYNNLLSAGNYFSNFNNTAHSSYTVFPANNIDEYSDGPLQTNLANINEALNSLSNDGDLNSKTTPWPGADNPNRFYSLISDLFDTTKLPQAFVNRISQGGSAGATYDRYTFYRLLSQLGTDSSVDSGKLNLNYMNVDVTGNVVPGLETNLVRWPNASCFFTNAADRMLHVYTTNWFQRNPSNYLASYYGLIITNYINPDGYGLTNVPYYGMTNQVPGFGIGNIPVYLNGRMIYSTAINRVLQVAANIYDASTNAPYPQFAFFPSVFRPLLHVSINAYETNVSINGYEQITGLSGLDYFNNLPGHPVEIAYLFNQPVSTTTNYNVYGVPWIIGAKKYMPNFNQFTLLSQVQVTRKLEFTRPNTSAPLSQYRTNEAFIINVSNSLSANFWNSYSGTYPGGTLDIGIQDRLLREWSNGPSLYGQTPVAFNGYYQKPAGTWSGSGWNANKAVATRIPLTNAFVSFSWADPFIPTVAFLPTSGIFTSDANIFDQSTVAPLPPIQLLFTNWLFAAIMDGNHVIDFVELASPYGNTNLPSALADQDPSPRPTIKLPLMWSTNLNSSGAPNGILNQISVSSGGTVPYANMWNPNLSQFPSGNTSIADQQTFFKNFFVPGNAGNTELTNQAPYTPTRTIFSSYLMQVNDPLVHYLATDLNGIPGSTAAWANQTYPNGLWQPSDDPAQDPLPAVPTTVNSRYQPWGVMKQMAAISGLITNAYDPSFKDPLAWSSDYWDFPTNAYPTVGWLGRVHRGTPWQTVYLKATDLLAKTLSLGNQGNVNAGVSTWSQWTGDLDLFDSDNSAPVQDRLLFDVFTTKLDDNAARGALSINQNNLSAWSALFSGMIAISNTTPFASGSVPVTPTTKPLAISPAGVTGSNSPLWQLVANINATRANGNLFPGNSFTHLGDVLAAPALSEASPFLNTSTTAQLAGGISDEMYEWLPQQALPLLKVSTTPRYVIYGYGQSLRPAQGATYSGAGSLFGLVTNYQVMAESAVRAVVQVHPQVTATVNGYVTNYTTTVESYDILPPN